MSELTGEESTVTAGQLHKAVAETMRNVAAENERLRAFVAAQNDQLLAVNAEIETLRVRVLTLEAQIVDAQGKARYWKAEYNDGQRRLEIIQKALIEAGLIESDWDSSEEEDTREVRDP